MDEHVHILMHALLIGPGLAHEKGTFNSNGKGWCFVGPLSAGE